MQSRDKISKSSWTMVEGVKDTVVNNLMQAINGKHIKVETSQLASLINLINSSVEEGYHKGHRSFMKSVDAAVEEETKAAQSVKKK